MGLPRLIAKLSNMKSVSSSTFDEDKNTNWHSYDSWLVSCTYFVEYKYMKCHVQNKHNYGSLVVCWTKIS